MRQKVNGPKWEECMRSKGRGLTLGGAGIIQGRGGTLGVTWWNTGAGPDTGRGQAWYWGGALHWAGNGRGVAGTVEGRGVAVGGAGHES